MTHGCHNSVIGVPSPAASGPYRPWLTAFSPTHCLRMPHASEQLPKDGKPRYRVEKGHCSNGPRPSKVPQEPRPAAAQAAGQLARPGWSRASGYLVVLLATTKQHVTRPRVQLTSVARLGHSTTCGFIGGRISGGHVCQCCVLSPAPRGWIQAQDPYTPASGHAWDPT